MDRILVVLVVVLTIYGLAVTHRLGILEGENKAWASVSSQVESGNLDLKSE